MPTPQDQPQVLEPESPAARFSRQLNEFLGEEKIQRLVAEARQAGALTADFHDLVRTPNEAINETLSLFELREFLESREELVEVVARIRRFEQEAFWIYNALSSKTA